MENCRNNPAASYLFEVAYQDVICAALLRGRHCSAGMTVYNYNTSAWVSMLAHTEELAPTPEAPELLLCIHCGHYHCPDVTLWHRLGLIIPCGKINSLRCSVGKRLEGEQDKQDSARCCYCNKQCVWLPSLFIKKKKLYYRSFQSTFSHFLLDHPAEICLNISVPPVFCDTVLKALTCWFVGLMHRHRRNWMKSYSIFSLHYICLWHACICLPWNIELCAF